MEKNESEKVKENILRVLEGGKIVCERCGKLFDKEYVGGLLDYFNDGNFYRLVNFSCKNCTLSFMEFEVVED